MIPGTKQKPKTEEKCHRMIFEITSIDDAMHLLMSLNEKALRRMCIYYYNSSFYISVPRFPVPVFIWEFSKTCRRNATCEAFLSEHGRIIAKGEQVVKMSNEIKKIF